MLGLESGRVKLLREHAAWAREFFHESRRIFDVLHPHILGIEHVGSTALPDVPAKPVLDLLIEVQNFEQAQVCIAPMEQLGYEYRAEYGIPRRRYFVKGDPRTHHVHMLEMGGDAWQSMLGFRDALLARPEFARQYADAKLHLAALHANDRGNYQHGKDRVIGQILNALADEVEPVEKVIAYITHGQRVLVFSEPDFPETGIQVPGGSLEAGETPTDAVLREAHEETGLEGLRITRFLGTNFYHSPTGRIWRRHYFHLSADGPVPERWEHWEIFADDGEPPIRLNLWWVEFSGVSKLAGGRGALIPMIFGCAASSD